MNDQSVTMGVSVWIASDVLVANLEISDVYYTGLEVKGDAGATRVHAYNLWVHDTGEQLIKANPPATGPGATDSSVECSYVGYGDNGPPMVDHGGGTGYTQAIDVHSGQRWLLQYNYIYNLHVPDTAQNLWNPAILFWNHDSADNRVIANTVVNTDRAIAMGLIQRSPDNLRGVVAGNMVYMSPGLFSDSRKAGADAPVIAWSSPGTIIYGNTIVTHGNHPNGIQARFPETTGVVLQNNLSDMPPRSRDNAAYTENHNNWQATVGMFVDPTVGDLHLNSASISGVSAAGAPLVNVMDVDYDGEPRGGAPDIGADQVSAPSPGPTPMPTPIPPTPTPVPTSGVVAGSPVGGDVSPSSLCDAGGGGQTLSVTTTDAALLMIGARDNGSTNKTPTITVDGQATTTVINANSVISVDLAYALVSAGTHSVHANWTGFASGGCSLVAIPYYNGTGVENVHQSSGYDSVVVTSNGTTADDLTYVFSALETPLTFANPYNVVDRRHGTYYAVGDAPSGTGSVGSNWGGGKSSFLVVAVEIRPGSVGPQPTPTPVPPSPTPAPSPTAGPTPPPSTTLLQPSDLNYLGYFWVPLGDDSSGCTTPSLSWATLAFRASDKSLFLGMHQGCSRMYSRYSIPAALDGTASASLLDQSWGQVPPDPNNSTESYGAVYDDAHDRLCATRVIWYNVFGGESPDIACIHSTGSYLTQTVDGPYEVGPNQQLAGQPAIDDDGTFISGLTNGDGTAGSNHGPAAWKMDLRNSPPNNPPLAVPLMTHMQDNPEIKHDGTAFITGNDQRGYAIIGGTYLASVQEGSVYYYGDGCGGAGTFQGTYGFPARSCAKGYHLDPYHPYLYFYDKSQFGVKDPKTIHPYAYKSLEPNVAVQANINGLGVDKSLRRIYLAEVLIYPGVNVPGLGQQVMKIHVYGY